MEQKNTFLCFIFFVIYSLGWITTATGSTNETDHQVLLAIKKDLKPGDSLGVFSSWNHSIHFCNWQGVMCGRRHHRVTALNLSSLALVGSLSPNIGNLSFLRSIDLSNNSFHSEIPPEIGRLFRLQYLILRNNFFQGEFPTNVTRCSDFRVIDVYNNNLGGKIPSDMGSLSSLLQLNLRSNNFTGTIPPSIGNISSLRFLSLAHNNLEGSIPVELVQLSKLEILYLSFNKLYGTIPTSLYNISSITAFIVSANLLHGSLPRDLGLTLPRLERFYVHTNQFYGPIPSSIANASGLLRIDIDNNSFTGLLPTNLGNLRKLQMLIGWGNKLGNELNFLTSLSNCSNLHWLDLAENLFKGLLPLSIANLSTKLTFFALDDNFISGSIPLEITKLVNLRTLFLDNNMLTGGIPNSIGKLFNLEKLYIDGNNISGKIPSSVGNITRLGILKLRGNMLERNIPVSLGNCANLNEIDFGDNHLAGAIPPQIFGLSSLIVVFLNQNYLTGLLPLEVGNLKNLGKLDVSDNKLSGKIPATLGSCQVLEFLNMKANNLEGTIPTSFEQLKGIQVLDVSRNNLFGQIPRFLGELPFIQSLNLSYNMFDGEVPNEGVFANISAFSVIGNNKLCGGVEALQMAACPMKVLDGQKQPFNRRVIALVVTLSIVMSLVCLSAILYRIRRSRKQASSAPHLPNHYLQLSYGEFLKATNGFSSANLIGEGKYGSVYKAIFNSGEQIVAVKVLKLHEHGASKSFIAECEAMKNIRHRNLLKIITSCSSIDFEGNDFKALVFEFMEKGSLESWLHPSLSEQQEPKNLNFVQRLNIAIDVAYALDYLHHQCETAIIHCDLKPSNVLLNDDLCAHVSDFGLTRILAATKSISNHQQSSSLAIRGTIGYVAPEYGMGEEVSTQGDMYSYGVLLLEMFTGRRPTDNMFSDSINLHSYTKMSLPNQVMEIVDPRIILQEEVEPSMTRESSTTNIFKVEVCIVLVLQIGVSCSAKQPSERMNARDVLMELHKIRNVFIGVRRQESQDERRNDS